MYEQKHVSNIFKTAYVTPVYKKGGRLEPTNYRPISVLPTVAKIFERLLLEQLTHHQTLFGLISRNQFSKGKVLSRYYHFFNWKNKPMR